ncbi:DUF3060 domain-containing protein [Pseudoxanthomonas winnipegensis]|jgi:hypothetical protein|uniref:DUF3060 domain-containing protein n=2 Tax=Pseudoxanthomonas winnipegensis TaxID=2480810 RepID=A0ABY1WG55_9GAMM|nr:DUF3060 domain-containing protein [Pseudoxanthomonas winnipegensis]TAA20854.1 DUF3060 domain-containing protein [Pseudoxanthomonas winnipegensis]TAH72324.1 DUF3060 domain-containing protein [Pseudoxanthomonas winnipegensis]
MRAIRTMVTIGLMPGILALTACGGASPSASPPASPAAAAQTLVDPASGAQCGGKDLRLTRDRASVVIDGACGAVVITGSHVELNLSQAQSLRVEGHDISVLNEKLGQATVTGQRNTLNLTQVDLVQLEGDDNVVLATRIGRIRFLGNGNTLNPSGKPAVEDRGRDNKVL